MIWINIKSKLKLIRNQNKGDFSFLDFKNKYLKKFLNRSNYKSQLFNVHENLFLENIKKIKNPYFSTDGNMENLRFVFAITKKLRIKQSSLTKTINNFKGLNYRQQIVYRSKKLIVINDSKATSFSSTINILKSLNKVFWLVGGIPKSRDIFFMSKNKCINFKAYIYGKNKKYFIKKLKNKVKFETFEDLKSALKKTIYDIRTQKIKSYNTILFSPSASSFDSFKNFEDRGKKFNELFKKFYLKK